MAKRKTGKQRKRSAAASVAGRAAWAALSPKKRSAINRQRAASRSPSELANTVRAAAIAQQAAKSPAQRKRAASKLAKSITPEAARARALAAWETKRRKAAESA